MPLSFRISPLAARGRRDGGVALVIVLAFVVLLTGLILAFFSRALSERQISNSSANETKTDIFAQGTLATVIGDLQQEIAAGSTVTNPATGVLVFRPKTPAAAAPCLARVSGTDTPLNSANLNLVKRSANNVPFYAGSSYDTTNYPPSNRAAGSSSLSISQNGRTISPARWNKALLLPKATLTSDTDFTPAGATAASSGNPATWSMAPDWVVAARDGTNPTTWSNALVSTGSNPAIGRFAYNVYDEGGLLDANVAGYPTDPTVAAPPGNYPAYKKALAFADLKQLPGIADLPTSGSPSRQEQVIRTLTGWRNFASAAIDPTAAAPSAGTPVAGSVNVPPGYTWTATNVLNYLNFAQLNGTGFLRAGNPLLVSNQSDRFFGSRQQLMNLLLGSVADQSTTAAGTAERASLQNALQYLGTFSRDLNQPSLAPLPASLTPDATHRPAVLAVSAGGNDSSGKDAVVNPSFLTIRVINPFTRFDGTTAQVGEPLVKKRFPLQRLAWLNCRGPSSQFATSNNTDVTALVNAGISRSFLQLGTDDGTNNTNIPRYFGLTWDSTSHRWTYMHGNNGAINTLDQVAALTGSAAREPDFIELLKAGISAGAIAKSSVLNSATSNTYKLQSIADGSCDYAIIQIAANIVDQFDADSFPTRIYFPNNSSLITEFRGVENLPYLNRIRAMVVKAAAPSEGTPATPDYNNGSSDYPTTRDNTNAAYTLKDTGVGVALYYPELWNPHDWNVNNPAQTLGATGQQPVNFQVVAVTDPAITDVSTFPIYGYNPEAGNSNGADPTASPGFATRGFSFSPPLVGFTEANTLMTFQVPATTAGMALFREPTLLLRPGKPTNSNFAAPGFAGLMPGASLSQFAATGGGIKSAVTDGVLNDPLTQGYVGFYAGAFPLRWVKNASNYGDRRPAISGTVYSYFRLKCEDAFGTMQIYDEKYAQLPQSNDQIMVKADAGFFNPYYKNTSWCAATDPRTGRFGFVNGMAFNGYPQDEAPPYANGTAWLNASEGITTTQRADRSSGGTSFSNPGASWLPWFFPNSLGWYPGSPTVLNDSGGTDPTLRLGLLSQNNPGAPSDGRKTETDTATTPTTPQYYADADGVVRRAMAGLVPVGNVTVGTNKLPADSLTGLPMATANSGGTSRTSQSDSRPLILNRPFRSTAELGYVFSGTPWKNLSFFTPESGYAALLDVFCTSDTDDAGGLAAGRVDLNTRQAPVLQSILAGAYRDEWNVGAVPSTNLAGGSPSVAQQIAQLLVARTTGTAASQGPLANVSELVGRWVGPQAVSGTTLDGSQSYAGLSADLSSVFGTSGTSPDASANNIQRFRESAIRPLASVGTARVWNLMIDLVAQTGRYPQSAATATAPLGKFVVEGETRLWLHVAIDRYTGRIIDKNLEIVKE